MIALTLIIKPEIFALFHGWNNYNSWIVKFQGCLSDHLKVFQFA